MPALAASIQAQAVTGLVGYSLGGLIALQALQQHPGLPVTTLVCLGALSAAARPRASCASCALAGCWAAADSCWARRSNSAPAQFRIGQVAGNRPLGLGRLLGAQGRDSDGTVGLAETHWPGLAGTVWCPPPIPGCRSTGRQPGRSCISCAADALYPALPRAEAVSGPY